MLVLLNGMVVVLYSEALITILLGKTLLLCQNLTHTGTLWCFRVLRHMRCELCIFANLYELSH